MISFSPTSPAVLVGFHSAAAAGTWVMARAMSTTHPVDTPEAASKAGVSAGPDVRFGLHFLGLELRPRSCCSFEK